MAMTDDRKRIALLEEGRDSDDECDARCLLDGKAGKQDGQAGQQGG